MTKSLARAAGALASAAAVASLSCGDADTIVAVYSPSAGGAGGAGGAGSAGTGGVTGGAPKPAAFYLEAEEGALSGAFSVGQSGEASAGLFIVASVAAETQTGPGSARALYTFDLAQAGEYLFWGRIHSPAADRNRYWLRVDAGEWWLWRISTGDAWFWDDIHHDIDYAAPLVFSLDAGVHTLELGNAVTGAELDRLYITTLGDEPPGNTTPCDPPHSVELGGTCERSCGSQGNVSCDPEACLNRPTLQSYDCMICCSLG